MIQLQIMCPVCGASMELAKRPEFSVPAATYTAKCRRPDLPSQRVGDTCWRSVPLLEQKENKPVLDRNARLLDMYNTAVEVLTKGK